MFKNLIFVISSIFYFMGCATARNSLPVFNDAFIKGDYQYAQKHIERQIGKKYTSSDLLWLLQAGLLARNMNQFELSNEYFDKSEVFFKDFDLQAAAAKSFHIGKSILLNDSFIPYTGKMYDRIMVNTYKALNFAALQDFKNARIEFNRALSRQNAAKTLFEKQAVKLKEEFDKENKNFDQDSINNTLKSSDFNNVIKNNYKNLENFKFYADFINPFTTYIAGLFFWLEGDSAKAIDILKEAYAMVSGNNIVENDFKRISRKDNPDNELWIIFENGLGPLIEESRIDIPVFLVSNEICYIGTALPNLLFREEPYPFLTISTNEQLSVRTEILSSIDNIVASEFQKELPGIIFREVSRVIFKTAAQYKMEKNYGPLAGLASGMYQALTTAVDQRIWSSLPKNFQVAHLNIPEDKIINIINDEGQNEILVIPDDCKNAILYVRVVAANLKPIYHLIKFK